VVLEIELSEKGPAMILHQRLMLTLLLAILGSLPLNAQDAPPSDQAPAEVTETSPPEVTEVNSSVPAQAADQNATPAPEQPAFGSVVFAVREAKSGKGWFAKKVEYRFEIEGASPLQAMLPNAGPTAPVQVPRGLHKLHIKVGDRVLPPKTVLIVKDQTVKFEVLVAGGGKVDIRQTLDLGPIAFEPSKALLLEESKSRLDILSELLKRRKVIKVVSIEGFTDSSGQAQKNVEISAQRAKAVLEYLVSQGIDKDRLESHGYGPERPIVDNATAANRALNRRVEFVIKELTEKDEEHAVAKVATAMAEAITESAKVVFDTVIHPWIFLGVDYGAAKVNTRESKELDKNGSYLAAKAMVNFYFPLLTIEGGGGIFNSTFKRQTRGNVIGESASIQTVYILGAARYAFDSGLEAGVTSQIMFGAANDFGPVEKAKHENYFMGPELVYQPPQFKNVRVATAWVRDYTINTRDVDIITLGVQVGMEVRERARAEATVTPAVAVAPALPVPAENPEPAPVPEVKPLPMGSLILSAREANSGKKWATRNISYKVLSAEGAVLNGAFADGGPTAPQPLAPGEYTLVVTVGDRELPASSFVVLPENSARIEVLAAAAGRIELRQLIDIGQIKFESNNDVLLEESTKRLESLATLLKERPAIERISIDGFTDSSGQAAKNQSLSERRAKAVENFLISKGIEPGRLESHGYGALRPLVDNATPEGRALNRRVEFVVLKLNNQKQP
jgi:outer membrane protein OmpA-like peptidoglycan-associated protein